ncbi:MAG: hypothetical protein Tsb0020_21880 [Haliangiales bacterium]
MVAGGAAASAQAAPSGPTCELVEPGFVEVDGLLDDWRDIASHRTAGAARDGNLGLRCAYDDQRVYIAVEIRDQDVVRKPGKQAKKAGNDGLTMRLGLAGGAQATLTVSPGVDGIAPARSWRGRQLDSRRGAGAIEIEDSLQKYGWSLELALPMSELDGLSAGVPGLSAEIRYRDVDRSGGGRDAQFDGVLIFRASAEAYRSLLKTVKLTPGQVRLDVVGEFDDAPGVERVVAGGKVLAVVTDRYAYMGLPVASAADVLKIEAVDLRGDGTRSIVALLRQHGNGGSRELLTVWGLAGGGRFERLLAAEISKTMGPRSLRNRWSIVPRASGAGRDIRVEVDDSDVKGWTEANYLEVQASDVRPILTPWAEETAFLFSLEGNAMIIEAAPEKPPARKRRRRR